MYLCHDACHENGEMSVQRNRRVDQALKAYAQKKAMRHYGLSADEFRGLFGKNYIDTIKEEKEA